jgi:hypothetical protein
MFSYFGCAMEIYYQVEFQLREKLCGENAMLFCSWFDKSSREIWPPSPLPCVNGDIFVLGFISCDLHKTYLPALRSVVGRSDTLQEKSRRLYEYDVRAAAGYVAYDVRVAPGYIAYDVRVAAGYIAYDVRVATGYIAYDVRVAAGYIAYDVRVAAGYIAYDVRVSVGYIAYDVRVAPNSKYEF